MFFVGPCWAQLGAKLSPKCSSCSMLDLTWAPHAERESAPMAPRLGGDFACLGPTSAPNAPTQDQIAHVKPEPSKVAPCCTPAAQVGPEFTDCQRKLRPVGPSGQLLSGLSNSVGAGGSRRRRFEQ